MEAPKKEDLIKAIKKLLEGSIKNDFSENVINYSVKSIPSYYKEIFYRELFQEACLSGKKEHAKKIIEDLIGGYQNTDVSMLNYGILKQGDLNALKIYSSLVDMNYPKKKSGDRDDWCHIYLPAMKGEIDKLKYCHEIGYASEEGYSSFNFVVIMVTSNLFEEAKEYAKENQVTPGQEEWDRAIKKLARNHEGRKEKSPIERINTLKEIYPGRKITTSNPYDVIQNALGNMAVDVADYIFKKIKNKSIITSTESIEGIFNKEYGYGYVYKEVIEWLLEIGAEFNKHQLKKILIDQSFREDNEELIKLIISKLKKNEVPWVEMLVSSCGNKKSKVIEKMKFYSEIHKYKKSSYEKALLKLLTGWKDIDLIKSFKEEFNVEYNKESLVEFTQITNNTNKKDKILIDILRCKNVDVNYNNDEAIFNEIEKLIYRGGEITSIKILLENGAKINTENGKAYARLKSYYESTGYRKDLLNLVNSYLEDKDKIINNK